MSSYDSSTPTNIWSGTKQLLHFFSSERRELVVILLYGLLGGLLSLAVPVAVNSVVSTVAFGTLLQPLLVLVIAVFAGLGVAAIVKLLQVYTVEIIQRRLFVETALKLAGLLPRFELTVFKHSHGPELINRFLEIVPIQKITAAMLLEGVTVLFQTALGLLLLGFYHPSLLAFGVVLVISILFIILLGWGAVPTAIKESVEKYRVLAWLEELARHPVLYKSKEGSLLALSQTDRLCLDYLRARGKHFRIHLRQHIAALTVQVLASGGLLALGGYLVIKEELTLGQLVAAELVVSGLLTGLTKLGYKLGDVYDLIAAIDKLHHVFDIPTESFPGSIPLSAPGPLKVEFHEVSVSYGEGGQLMKNVSFTLEPGAKASIFGKNGSGKSSLANLLYKLELPQKGYILINGFDIREISTESLRGQVSLVRGIEVIPGSIEENLRLHRHDLSGETISQALKQVGLFDSIAKLPQGLSTLLSGSGAPLSRGELLLLMLARALLTEPKLLVLDETLDGIDPSTLEKVYDTLLAKNAPWTLVDFTHETHVWEHFSNHYVIEQGVLERK